MSDVPILLKFSCWLLFSGDNAINDAIGDAIDDADDEELKAVWENARTLATCFADMLVLI